MHSATIKTNSTENIPVSRLNEDRRFADKHLKAAVAYCRDITNAHYENFPVASLIVPARLRPALRAIYAFSRMADDFADEPRFAGERLQRLDEWGRWLEEDHPTHPVFVALQDARHRHGLPLECFTDLLSAFRQDSVKNRYADFNEVLDYCRRSANPVGRLVLHLFGVAGAENVALSDNICTALQLTNFWQDTAVDAKRDRIYLPADERARFGVSDAELQNGGVGGDFVGLMRLEIERTSRFFHAGHELGLRLRGRIGAEIRLTWLTGRLILEKTRQAGTNIPRDRPTLKKRDILKLLPPSLDKRLYRKAVREWDDKQ